MLFVVWSSLFDVCFMLRVVRSSLFVARCLLFVVYCLLLGIFMVRYYLWFVVCGLCILCVVCGVWFVVC